MRKFRLRRARRKRRNAWGNDAAGHRRAALKGWSGRRKKSKGRKRRGRKAVQRRRRMKAGTYRWRKGAWRRKKAANPLYRSRRGRFSGRRTRRRVRNKRRNPGGALAITKPISAVTAGFNVDTLMTAGVMTGGAVANRMVYRFVSGLPFVPDFLKSGIGQTLGKVAMAGLTGAGIGMVNRKWGQEAFLGGMMESALGLASSFGLAGLGDFLSVADLARRQPLGDYATPQSLEQAKPLGLMPDEVSDSYVAEELAAIA